MTGGDYRKNPAVGTQFKVQIGSYATPNMSEFDRVNDLGFVSTETANNGMERVVIGPFSDKKSAEDALMQIRYRGFGKAYLVKYKNGLRVGR